MRGIRRPIIRRWIGELVPQESLERRIVALTFVQAVGSGLFLTSSAIFLTTVVGLSPTEVGIGLSVAGLFGFAAAVPAGRTADRWGAGKPLALCYLLLAATFLAYCWVSTFLWFVVVASLVAAVETACSPLRSALAFALFGPGAATIRAQMRSSFNLGFAVGAALAALALVQGTRGAFVTVLAVDAVAHLACAVVAVRLPNGPATAAEPSSRSRSALRDRRFVRVALLSGGLELYQSIMDVAVPLWIVTWTVAPPALNAALLVLNTLAMVLLQVAASRGADTARGGARLLRRSGVLLAAACVVYAASAWGDPLTASLVLIAGSVLLALGELAQSAGGYALAFELPPPGRQGDYQGVFALGRGLQQFVGPALATAFVVGLGAPGWLLLAALFLLLALACVPLVRNLDAEAGRTPA